MSYTRLRSVPGRIYGVKSGTRVESHPLKLSALGLRMPSSRRTVLDGCELALVIANEQDVETMCWSLCLISASENVTYGWIYNDDLQWSGLYEL